MIGLKDALARSAASARLYVDFTAIDAPHANPRLLGSDSNFTSSNAWGGAPVYPVVVSWGGLDKGDVGGSATITFAANAIWVPATSNEKMTVTQWFRELNLRDVAISIYQWSEESTTQSVVWAGFIYQIETLRVENGVPVLDMVLSASAIDMVLKPASDVIEKSGAFINAPDESVGLMVPLHYGDIPNRIWSTGTPAQRNTVGMVGHAMHGVRALNVSENVTVQSISVRVAKNDGTSAAGTFIEAATTSAAFATTTHIPLEQDLWVYDQGLASYGMVDAISYTPVNDTAKVECDVSMAPRIHFFVRPSVVGDTTAAALQASIYKLTNSDMRDFSTSSTTDYIWALECPEVPIKGTVRSVKIMVDWENAHVTMTRQIQFGLWDVFKAAGAGYLDGVSATPPSRVSGSDRILNGTTGTGYIAYNFRSGVHTGGPTDAEFRSGRFVTRGTTTGQEATLQLRCEVNDLGGGNAGRGSVRIYHIIMVVEVEYPMLQTLQPLGWPAKRKRDRDLLERRRKALDYENARAQINILEALRGTDFFGTGAYQKDDGSGTYTGSAAAVIERPCDIAHHLIHKHFGKTRNATAGTLGNFVDARTTLLASMFTLASFGPEEMKRGEVIEQINQSLPLSVFEEDKIWYCIPDDMNPHSSRIYRSSADPVTIGPEDIEDGSFTCRETAPEDMINSVIVNHSHGYPDREPARSVTYDNKLSQMYFTKKAAEPIEAPMLITKQHGVTADVGPLHYAQWAGRRSARPRLMLSVKLAQKFYDLRRGHIVQFKNLEDIGVYCRAFRCGLLDYHFQSAASTTNYADSLTPTFLVGGATGVLYLGLSQQVEQITFLVGTAATYTTVADSWKYSNDIGTFYPFTDALTTNKDGLKSTGTQTIGFTRPAFTTWCKQELTFGAFGVAGPCYWLSMNYTSAGTAGTGSGRTTYPALWYGRGFEVMKASRVPSGEGQYMAMGVQLMEIM